MRRTPALLVLALTAAAGLFGCVERTITITSSPAGALVHLNDEEVGRTPVSVPFTFHGEYDLRLEHEGATPLWATRHTQRPWWDWPGLDLVVELLPGRRHANTTWHFDLPPRSRTAEDAKVLDRAQQMRSQVESIPAPKQP